MRRSVTRGTVGDAELKLGDVRVVATRRGSAMGVVMYHPLFAQVPGQVQRQITFLSLESALGEEAVELCVGSIDQTPCEPTESRALADLPVMLAGVIVDAMPNGEMGWTLLRGDGSRGPVLVSCLNRLSPVQSPNYDEHVAVTVPFRDSTAEGWPGSGFTGCLAGLRGPPQQDRARPGELVALETSDGVRTLHYYVDSTTPAADQLQAAVHGWDQGPIALSAKPDPAREAVALFRN